MKRRHFIFSIILLCASFTAFVVSLVYFIQWASSWTNLFSSVQNDKDVLKVYLDMFGGTIPQIVIPFICTTIILGFTIYFFIFFRKNYALVIRQQREAIEQKRNDKEVQEKLIKQQQIADLEKQLEELKKDDN